MALGALHPSLALPPSLAPVGIPASTAHILSLLFATSYVGSIYLATHFSAIFARSKSQPAAAKDGAVNGSDATTSTAGNRAANGVDGGDVIPPQVEGGPKPGERDHPDTIKLRMKAVGTATLVNLGVTFEVVRRASSDRGLQSALTTALRLCGLPTSLSPSSVALPDSSSACLRAALPYALAPTLLLGPLVAMYLDSALPFQGYGTLSSRLQRQRTEWGLVEWRNYVVGPLTEELTFRSCILAVSILARCSPRWLVFGTPLWFGVAHLHHAWEVYKLSGAVSAVAVTMFQLTYTTLFGWFASYLFIRTGSLLPPLAAHVFCNMMGIYLPNTAVARHPRRKWVIIGSYILGIAGFAYGLRFL